MKDHVFYRQIGSVMRDNMYDRQAPSHRGKLNTAKLWKAETGNRRLFLQKSERKNKEFFVSLVVDESGSMYSQRCKTAANVVATILHGLEINGIRVNVVGFNEFLVVYKTWWEPYTLGLGEEIKKNVNAHPQNMGGRCNHDYQAMEQGFYLLQSTKSLPERQIFMSFTDGEPACGCGYGAGGNYLRGFFTRVRKSGIHVINFGIQTDVSDYYPGAVTIESLTDFKPKAIHALERIIVRG